MQPNQKSNLLHEPTPAEIHWADELLKDIFCGCVLNLKLKRAGLCPKYLCDMTQNSDYREYGAVLEHLLLH